MLVNEKDRFRKIPSSREGTVLVDRCTEDWMVPLLWHYITKSGRVRRKGLDYEAWSFWCTVMFLTLKQFWYKIAMLSSKL